MRTRLSSVFGSVLLAAAGSLPVYAAQVQFTFTTADIVSAYSTQSSWNGSTKTGWLGSYSYGSAGGNGRPANYLGGNPPWSSSPATFGAGIVDFFARIDNFDGSNVASYSVISQTSSVPSLFSVGTSTTLPNYGSSAYQNTNSGLTTFINTTTNPNKFLQFGDNTGDSTRSMIFTSNIGNAALPGTFTQVQNASFTTVLDGNFNVGSQYTFVFFLYGDQFLRSGVNWNTPAGASKDTILGTIALNVTAESAVPEPGSMTMMGGAALLLAEFARRRRNK
jgi:hypothetical protein